MRPKKDHHMMKRIAVPFLAALTIMVLPMIAQAQRRSPLADAPAIRKRLELRETRLELGAGLGTTVNQTFYHGLTANVRLGFHLTDWLSISGVGGFGVSALSTGFRDRLITSLEGRDPENPADERAPSPAVANAGLNKTKFFVAGQAELTPFTGKYSMFGKLFAHYDFYLFGGVAAMNFAAANPSATPACSTSAASGGVCVASGMQIGGTFGGGFHSFFSDSVALNIELRDILVKDNPAGRDVNGDTNVDKADLTWTSHYMAIFGLTLYLPTTASISP
jgi:outer membrane beta-barrel protein